MFPDLASLPVRPAEIQAAWLRYRVPAVVLFLLVAGAAFGGSLFLPRSYYSEAKFLVKVGRENLILEPTAATGQIIPMNESREGEINSLVEIFRSRALLDRVVEEIGAENLLNGGESPLARMVNEQLNKISQDKAAPLPDEQSAGQARPGVNHLLAIQALEKSVFINSPRRTNVIAVGAKASSPELAQQIVDAMTKEFTREHRRLHNSSQSYEFFVNEAAKNEQRVSEVRNELRAVKDKHGILTIEGKRGALQGRLADLEQRKGLAETELAQNISRIAALEKLITDLPELELSAETGVAHPGAFDMQNTLFQFKLAAIDQLTRYTDDHPLAQAARQRLIDGEQALSAIDPMVKETTKAAHPLKQKLKLDLAQEQASLETTRSRLTSLASQLLAANEELQSLNGYEIELAQLQQKVDVAELAWKQGNEKLEQARLNRHLDEVDVSNLKLVQAASYNNKPSGVSKKAVWLLGLVLAFTGAGGLPIGLACLFPQLRTRNDLERAFGVPVITSLKRPQPVYAV